MKKIVIMCDPPLGHKYGFPKVLPKECIDNWKKQLEWMISEGYPESIQKELGEQFYVRYWREEIDSE